MKKYVKSGEDVLYIPKLKQMPDSVFDALNFTEDINSFVGSRYGLKGNDIIYTDDDLYPSFFIYKNKANNIEEFANGDFMYDDVVDSFEELFRYYNM